MNFRWKKNTNSVTRWPLRLCDPTHFASPLRLKIDQLDFTCPSIKRKQEEYSSHLCTYRVCSVKKKTQHLLKT